MDQIKIIIKSVCRDLFHIDTEIELTRPDAQFGDYSTNIALKLSKQLGKPPMEIAETIAKIINNVDSEIIDKVTSAGPGFLNITLTSKALHDSYSNAVQWDKPNVGDMILVESGDPNPFKEMHLGHLYDSIEGDVVASLFESTGAEVKRLSYHGDVGLQIAKSIWGIGESINWDLDKLEGALKDKQLNFYYAKGSTAYEENEEAASKIREINGHIYSKDDEVINKIYEYGKKISFDRFDKVLGEIKIHNDKRYLESESSVIGLATVKDNIGKVFEQSDGAIVFKGEKVGLHTRVFINSKGLPTYEAKDLGLVELKERDYPKSTKSIVITGSEQTEYFKVMLAALTEISPELATKTVHIPHGFLTLTTGKMSSRTGDVYDAATLISEVKDVINQQYPDSKVKEEIFLAAIRYTFLKQKLGADIIFDVKDSVGLEGNSGPYIQYAHARAKSILEKAEMEGQSIAPELKIDQIPLQEGERFLAMKISEFPEVVEQAAQNCMPHHICTYLYELAQEFNRFYEHNRVINDTRMFTRLHIVNVYADVLKTGLKLLNIPAPLHM